MMSNLYFFFQIILEWNSPSFFFCPFHSVGRWHGMSPCAGPRSFILLIKKKAAAPNQQELEEGRKKKGGPITGRQSVFVITTQRPCHKVKWRQRTHISVAPVAFAVQDGPRWKGRGMMTGLRVFSLLIRDDVHTKARAL